MRTFLNRLSIFILIGFAVLSLLGLAVDHGLRKTRDGNFAEWNDIRNGINADLLVAGSSKAWVQISPFVLDTALNVNSYNLGLDGYGFNAQHMRFRYYEQFNSKPEYIIYAVDLFTLTKRPDLFMPEQFAPYLDDSIIAKGTQAYQGFADIDYYNPFTKYCKRPRPVAIGLSELLGIRHFESAKFKGYEGQNVAWDSTFEKARRLRGQWVEQLDGATIKLFDSFLADCKKKDIKVMMVYPPEYFEARTLIQNREEILSIYKQLSEKYDIVFLDYSDDKMSYNIAYFYNSQHLNRKGAELFTMKLSSDLLKIGWSNRW